MRQHAVGTVGTAVHLRHTTRHVATAVALRGEGGLHDIERRMQLGRARLCDRRVRVLRRRTERAERRVAALHRAVAEAAAVARIVDDHHHTIAATIARSPGEGLAAPWRQRRGAR